MNCYDSILLQYNHSPIPWHYFLLNIPDNQFSHRSLKPREKFLANRSFPSAYFLNSTTFGSIIHPGWFFEQVNECTSNIPNHLQWLKRPHSRCSSTRKFFPSVYLISSIFIEIFLDVQFSHGKAHVIVHISTTGYRTWTFGICSSKDSFELFSYRSITFGHVRCSTHHKSPNEIILHHTWWILFNQFRRITHKFQFTNRNIIMIN